MKFGKRRKKNGHLNPRELKLIDDPKSYFAESIRTIRTNLQFFSVDKELKTIVVTSPTAGEGKSTVSANLAVALAQNNKKVILIDGDIRKSVVHTIFDVNNLKGLSNLLLDIDKYHNYISKTFVEGLDVITSGPVAPNPSELLHSNAMNTLIDDLSSEYDYVVIDSAPVGLVTDGAVLAAKADGTILVCAQNETDKRILERAKNHLDSVNAHILGVVMNKVPIKGTPYYQNYYSSGYFGGKKE